MSPFSFFNLFSTNPPILIFAPNRRLRDGSNKHTFFNASTTHEVVINIVDYAMAEQMSLSSCEYPDGVDEFVKAGFTPISSQKVKPPRVG
ncbi:MAG TPA: flavin reductase family protein, partial [Saprospiraceae bacterium]|nr:flavin reductase family protein [Saprospiraceae bacterium]